MKRIYIGDLKQHIGEEVTIQGWVDVRRDHGKLVFIDLRDMSGDALLRQILADRNVVCLPSAKLGLDAIPQLVERIANVRRPDHRSCPPARLPIGHRE